MLKDLLKNFTGMLIKKEEKNHGFPDTQAMRTALFGQVAFRYEQEIQKIYNEVSKDIIDECSLEVDDILDKAMELDKEIAKK